MEMIKLAAREYWYLVRKPEAPVPTRLRSLDLMRERGVDISDGLTEDDVIATLDLKRRLERGGLDLRRAPDAGNDDAPVDKNTRDVLHRRLVRIGAARVVGGRVVAVPWPALSGVARLLVGPRSVARI